MFTVWKMLVYESSELMCWHIVHHNIIVVALQAEQLCENEWVTLCGVVKICGERRRKTWSLTHPPARRNTVPQFACSTTCSRRLHNRSSSPLKHMDGIILVRVPLADSSSLAAAVASLRSFSCCCNILFTLSPERSFVLRHLKKKENS